MEIGRLPSVQNVIQKKGTCFAHAMSRCLVRTLQILAVLPENDNQEEIQYEFLFYKLFFKIIVKKFSCEGGDFSRVIIYLINYLGKNLEEGEPYEDIFQILNDSGGNKSIDECDDDTCSYELTSAPEPILKSLIGEEKKKFEKRLESILPKLLIIFEIYTVRPDNKTNFPSPLIIDSLNKGLQPYISFTTSKNLKVELAEPVGYCNINGSHGIILKQWRKSAIVVKNTWDVNGIGIEPTEYNQVKNNIEQNMLKELRVFGDTTLSNMNQLSCINESTDMNAEIYFNVLTYDNYMLEDLDKDHIDDIESNKSKHTKNTDYLISEKFEQKSNYGIIDNPIYIKEYLSNRRNKYQEYNDNIINLLINIKAINFLYYCYQMYNYSKCSAIDGRYVYYILFINSITYSFEQLLNEQFLNEQFLNEQSSNQPLLNQQSRNKQLLKFNEDNLQNCLSEKDEFQYTPLHYIVESLKNNTVLFDNFLGWVNNSKKSNKVFAILKPLLTNDYGFGKDKKPFFYINTIQNELIENYKRIKNIKKDFYYKLIPKYRYSIFSGGQKTRRKFNKSKNKRKTRKS